MTRRDCMLKLLALGPLSVCECYVITGWPRNVVRCVLASLRDEGVVNHSGEWRGAYFL